MVEGSLDTTNLLLGIMAAVSVLEALLLIGAGIMGYRMYSEVMTRLRELEQRQLDPLMLKVNAILADVKSVTTRVSAQTERVDHAMRDTIDRVDETAERVRSSVRYKMNNIVGVARGLRAIIEEWLGSGAGRRPSARAQGPV
jgi:hypothetical protein